MALRFEKDTYSKLLVEYQPKLIQSEEEYDRTLAAIEKLMGDKERTPEEGTLLELLVVLVEEYENKHYPMPEVPPHQILEHLMEARGLRQVDLVGILGSKGVVSEVVNRKRSISKAQAKALAEFFHVSPELFI
jgi:HTH-type transcriptional regulator / antitoxin HigA